MTLFGTMRKKGQKGLKLPVQADACKKKQVEAREQGEVGGV
jgi:hypothetical protein